MYTIYQKNNNVDRIINLAWVTGASINFIEFIKLMHFNAAITVITGILAVVLLVYQILTKAAQYRQTKLKNKDQELHNRKEQVELSELLRKTRENRKKSRNGK